jgi:hypothetical protein
MSGVEPGLPDENIAIFHWLFALTVADLIVAYMPIVKVLTIAGLSSGCFHITDCQH